MINNYPGIIEGKAGTNLPEAGDSSSNNLSVFKIPLLPY